MGAFVTHSGEKKIPDLGTFGKHKEKTLAVHKQIIFQLNENRNLRSISNLDTIIYVLLVFKYFLPHTANYTNDPGSNVLLSLPKDLFPPILLLMREPRTCVSS